MENTPATVLIADSQYITSIGLNAAIAPIKDFKVVETVSRSNELTAALKHHKPNLLVIDYNSPGMLNMDDVKEAKKISPKTKILVVSSDHDRNNVFRVLEFGIINFLTKECDRDEIISALYATLKGEKFICARVVDLILDKHLGKADEDCGPTVLSDRENGIIVLIAKGLTNKEIAAELHLSPHTVSTHRKNIMRKLRINSVSEIVMYAVRMGLIAKT
ncbi:MAG TPA: response regulator transcription factor [Chitinophagales bacterium]|nr:response regulator transcription factor [Chitinophagales bacterium]